MFPTQVYIERRERLKKQVQSGVVLLLGNDESPMNYRDNPYPFRQDSSFLYLVGPDRPGLAAVIDIDENRETVYGRDLTVEDIVWMGPQPSLRETCQEFGIQDTAPVDALQGRLREAKQQGRKIHFLPPYRPEHLVRIEQILGIRPAAVSNRVSTTLIRAVVAQRSIKSEEEVEQIEAALAIAYEMQTTAMRMSRPGVLERDVAAAMESIALARGGRLAFPTIFSVHGETLHNHSHDNVMQDGDLAVNDSGAESPSHYASDVTRTIPVGGRFTERQREIYSIVLDAQVRAIEAVEPGVEFREIHRLACQCLASGLRDLGLMKGDVEVAVEAGAHALFFPCGVGHMIGLDVHDMEGLGENFVGYTDTVKRRPEFGWRALRLARALEAGFVVTVEPGLYFIPELIDRWKAERKCADFIDYPKVDEYRDFGGVRIEDDVLVTERGHRVLGPEIPRSIETVEALASG